MATNTPQINISDIKTYGALILPFDKKKAFEQAKTQTDPKTKTTFKGQLKSALNMSTEPTIKDMLKHPGKTFDTLAEYTKDTRMKISGIMNDVTSKFSGIAVAQALVNGKITSKEAVDYLFMGFAPALGVTGSLFAYSGLNQLKDALTGGTINVGAFVSGFTRTLKGLTDLKDNLTKKDTQASANILEFDLTISHTETYQSETPDRRVQSGQSLNEYVHNMPITYTVNCALQEGRRYSKDEFRSILNYLRERKETVQLVLGDEIFDSLILTDFSPNHDCSKSGMDYTLSFKKITRSDIDTKTEVTIQKVPIKKISEGSSSTGSLSSGSVGGTDLPDIKAQLEHDIGSVVPKIVNPTSIAKMVDKETGSHISNTIRGK